MHIGTTWYEEGLEKGREEAATWYDKGMEKGGDEGRKAGRKEGRKKGRAEGQRALAAAVLERRCGPLKPELKVRLKKWPEDRLSDLIDVADRVDSPDDLPLSPNGAND